MDYVFKLNEETLNLVLEGLYELPAKKSHQLINDIHVNVNKARAEQAELQKKEEAKEEVKEEKEKVVNEKKEKRGKK